MVHSNCASFPEVILYVACSDPMISIAHFVTTHETSNEVTSCETVVKYCNPLEKPMAQ